MNPAALRAMLAAIGEARGAPVELRGQMAVGGGCINRAAMLDTSAGRYFVKWNAAPPPGFFVAEAAGLRQLAKAGPGLKIPEVVAIQDKGPGTEAFLILEYLEPERGWARHDENLGRGLAALHRVRAPRFGLDTGNFCGLTPQRNEWTATWGEFFTRHRIGYQRELLRERGNIGREEERLLGKFQEILPGLIEDGEPPSLIHGDLWSGNFHPAAGGAAALVDPAVSYSHREAEWGMMLLFGGFRAQVLASYQEAYPLEAGWRERAEIYQVYHLLNHHLLFGGGYFASAAAIMRKYL